MIISIEGGSKSGGVLSALFLLHFRMPAGVARAESIFLQFRKVGTGTGDCGTFADAVIQAITYQQEHESQHTLVATLTRYTLETVATLGECLRRTRKVRPTPVLYLYLE